VVGIGGKENEGASVGLGERRDYKKGRGAGKSPRNHEPYPGKGESRERMISTTGTGRQRVRESFQERQKKDGGEGGGEGEKWVEGRGGLQLSCAQRLGGI